MFVFNSDTVVEVTDQDGGTSDENLTATAVSSDPADTEAVLSWSQAGQDLDDFLTTVFATITVFKCSVQLGDVVYSYDDDRVRDHLANAGAPQNDF